MLTCRMSSRREMIGLLKTIQMVKEDNKKMRGKTLPHPMMRNHIKFYDLSAIYSSGLKLLSILIEAILMLTRWHQ